MSNPRDSFEAVPSTGDFLWLDFEFTGLEIEDDVVVETAAVATDGLFNVVGEYSSFVGYPRDELCALFERNLWWRERPQHTQEMLDATQQHGQPLSLVAKELAAFAKDTKQGRGPLYLAGNSIHNDRKWVVRDFPGLEDQLHYRMLDVSSLKLAAQSLLGVELPKQERHRALDDIYESMDELAFTLDALKNAQ